MLNVPVALLIFNRPEKTRRVFAEIARARPSRLFVAAGAPRNPEEAKLCDEARAVVDKVDWDCEVLTNFEKVNLGCHLGPYCGINWVFDHCEQAIVLEDDCLPHPTFFPYCAELLERYRDDERVMAISGNNFQFGRKRTQHSYYFSRYPISWGWASWRRAWKYYETDPAIWQELRKTNWLLDLLGDRAARDYYTTIFDEVFVPGELRGWDYTWFFACWSQNGVAIAPSVNLVENIGFGKDATHTHDPSHPMIGVASEEMAFPLSHPPCMVWHREADQFMFDRAIGFKYSTLYGRLLRRIRLALPRSCPWPTHDLYD